MPLSFSHLSLQIQLVTLFYNIYNILKSILIIINFSFYVSDDC